MSRTRTSRFVCCVFVSAVILHAFNPAALTSQFQLHKLRNNSFGAESRRPFGGFGESDGATESNSEHGSRALFPGLSRPHHSSGMLHFRLRIERLSLIRNKILDLLNKTENNTSHAPQPRFSDQEKDWMVGMYERTLNETQKEEEEQKDDEVVVKSVRLITGQCGLPGVNAKNWTSNAGMRLYFDVSGYTEGQHTVVSSTLKVHKRMLRSSELQDVPGNPTSLPSSSDGLTRHQVGDGDVITKNVSPSVTDDIEPLSNDTNTQDTDDDIGEVRLTVYQLRYQRHNIPPFRRKLIETQAVTVDFEGWIKFEITNTVQKWINTPTKNYGLEIIVEPLHEDETEYAEAVRAHLDVCALNETSAFEPPTISQMYERFYPILEVVASESVSDFSLGFPGRREIRSAKRKKSPNKVCGGSSNCCQSPLYVSFEELHWESWIVLPKGFNTSFCTGSCVPAHIPESDDVERNFFWHQTNLKHSEKNACCGPTKLKSLTILYIDNTGKFGLVTFKDFIVQECGCRP